MSLEVTTDEDGFRLPLLRTKDGRFAGNTFVQDTIDNMPSVKLRDNDVLFCSYAKSGCHWIWQNVRMLHQGEVTDDAVDKEGSMMEYHDIDYLDNLPSPRFLNTHVFFDKLPSDLLKGNVKMVFVYRNPKDIAVSFYHHHSRLKSYGYEGKFSNYIKRFASGLVSNNSIFDYWTSFDQGLRKNPQIPHIVMSYEELKKNPVSERHRLAAFLGRNYDEEFILQVAEATSIDRMRQQKGGPKDSNGSIFYRKGEVGDWKNHFTVAESNWFDDMVASRLKDCKMFKFVYSL
ncbi:sulfotransferase 1C2 [Aplysia californica]|uniref:Sulfotransferase 1C2 n=1 Tax=Aplysia californica TaxID=6500 RepID=A0ABM0K814_APLCA|nr:sulfotransferase 1C2 [Aplysia californica]